MSARTESKMSTTSPQKPTQAARQMTYWLTRDSDVEGNLDETVDVWLARPTRRSLPGGLGAVWICDDIMVDTSTGDAPSRYASWTLAQCLRACYVYPDNDRESIKVG